MADDISTSAGPGKVTSSASEMLGRLVWKGKFKWGFARHAFLSNDQNSVVMVMEGPALFSSKPISVSWHNFKGFMEWEAAKSLWWSVLPFGGRIDTHIVLRSSSGALLTATTAVLNNPVRFAIGAKMFTYERITKNWRRLLVLKDPDGEIISGEQGTFEMKVLRPVESLEMALAVYWELTMCDSSI